jgi:hypothetical protein
MTASLVLTKLFLQNFEDDLQARESRDHVTFRQDSMILREGKAIMELGSVAKVSETRPWLGGVRLGHVEAE